MRHWLAELKKNVLEQSRRNNRIRGVIKKVARIHIMDSDTSRCWEPRRHQLRRAPYSSQMHSSHQDAEEGVLLGVERTIRK